MTETALSLKIGPGLNSFFSHDNSVVVVNDGTILFGVEDERLSRVKHGKNRFPETAIRAAMNHTGLRIPDVDQLVLAFDPTLLTRRLTFEAQKILHLESDLERLSTTQNKTRLYYIYMKKFADIIEEMFVQNFGRAPPSIKTISHHRAHAVSAHYLSPFRQSLVLTVDWGGEYDATVVWKADENDIRRVHTVELPNSIGLFYTIVTKYLGYHPFNGEGKIMGLAPYGRQNDEIYDKLLQYIDTGPHYDVEFFTSSGLDKGIEKLGELFDRPRKADNEPFDQWHKDLAYATQTILEEIMTNVVSYYCDFTGESSVALAGGVALNCKMNKRIRELDDVDGIFIQPVAHDAGVALGGALSVFPQSQVPEMDSVYWGPDHSPDGIVETLEEYKIDYNSPQHLERHVANRIADGDLVGWFQGRTEMGPRALGNRSILADSRTIESRHRVNKYVKHRENWRPFAPSLLREAADKYLVDATNAPYMIQTFDVVPEKVDEIPAVTHPSDNTVRPQTVTSEQNPRYHRLIEEFADITGVPVILNTSFNDSGEPIVNTPREALSDFYTMGLDILVLDDMVIEKSTA